MHRALLAVILFLNTAGLFNTGSLFSATASTAELYRGLQGLYTRNADAAAAVKMALQQNRLTLADRLLAGVRAGRFRADAVHLDGILYYQHLKNGNYSRAGYYLERLKKVQQGQGASAKHSGRFNDELARYHLLAGNYRSAALYSETLPAGRPPAPAPWSTVAWALFPGGGYFKNGHTASGLLSMLTVGSLAAASVLLFADNKPAAALVSGYFALVFYQVSIAMSVRREHEDYTLRKESWRHSLLVQSKYAF